MKFTKNNSLLTFLNRYVHIVAGAVLCLFSATSNAALLGIQPGFPQSNYDNQGTTTFSNMDLGVNASLIGFKFLASDIPYFTFGSLTMNAKIDAACTVSSNLANPEITLVGDVYDPNTFALVLSGTLLTGEIVAAGFQSVSATTTAIDFRFNSAGGLLVSREPRSESGDRQQVNADDGVVDRGQRHGSVAV